MDIYIGRDKLDIPRQDVSVHSSRIRFADILGDDYSTDITIPKTDNNIRILSAYMPLDRADIFRVIPATLCIGTVSEDGEVRVTSISDNSINIYVSVTRLLSQLADTRVRDMLQDTAETIITLDNMTATSSSASDSVAVWDYNQGWTDAGAVAIREPMKPSIKISKIMEMLSAASGLTLPSISSNAVLTPTKSIESRQNFRQTICKHIGSGGEDKTSIVGSSAWSVLPEGETAALVMTCDCDIRLDVRVRNEATYTAEYRISYDHGGVGHIIAHDIVNTADEQLFVSLRNGDVLRWGLGSADASSMLIEITYLEVLNADAEEHAITYHPANQCAGRTARLNRYGIIANLGDITIRELINSVAWHTGSTYSMVGHSVIIEPADKVKDISGTIVETNDGSEHIAKSMHYDSADGRHVLTTHPSISRQYEDSKVMSTSALNYVQSVPGQYLALIPEYTLEDGKYNKKEVKGLPISIPQNIPASTGQIPTGVHLRPTTPSTVLLPQYKPVGVVIETFDDVTGYDMVRLSQYTFAIVEVDKDIETGISTIQAIKI